MTGPDAYSRLDRLLHRIAFAQIPMQKNLASVEERLFPDRLAPRVDRPVFITSLPRAGTTLLLELVAALPEFAAHTYRHMPFVLCPLLWDRLSRSFQRAEAPEERAHGDGMVVGFDSPEAFEEVVWMAFWGDHYAKDRIRPWSAEDRDAAFEEFLQNHMRKIVGLGGVARRYVSKNNANLARLDLLTTLFPDAAVVVPVRNPWDHARSLRRQHERFLKLHAEDPFGVAYMRWLGHFEFGAALRPIDVAGWIDRNPGLDPLDDAFWLTYWAEAYGAILAGPIDAIHIVDYDRACSAPEPVMATLGERIGTESPARLREQVDRFRTPSRYGPADIDAPCSLVERVETTYRALLDRSIDS